MPKKRNYNFKILHGSSSISSKLATTSNGGENGSPSVNERLSELRKLEGKDAAAKKRQLAEAANQRSVPPEVRGILGVPESAPPKPKIGVRTRDTLRTPGPAPPKSWLANSSTWTSTLAMRGAKRGSRKDASTNDRNRPRQLLRFAHLTGLQNVPVDETPPRLSHIALKTIAECWDLFQDEDYPALVELPLRLRLSLISYIGFYGLRIDARGLQALLQGSETTQHLDLAGLLDNRSLTIKKVIRLAEKKQEAVSNASEDSVAESWDTDEHFEAALQPSPRLTCFSQLTHLCLSHPESGALWRDLLALTKLTPQLTHLSLAYWPRPTLTPNLATTIVTSRNSPEVTAGGSHYYSSLDDDLSEPASLLRQLSGNLLCLQWLDVEGCPEWVPALAKLAESTFMAPDMLERSNTRDGWTVGPATITATLVTNWKNLTYIRCAQGWLPGLTGVSVFQEMPSAFERSIIEETIKYLRGRAEVDMSSSEQPTSDVFDIEKKKARIWLQCEYKLTHASMQINNGRRRQGCKSITMDHGWIQRHIAPP